MKRAIIALSLAMFAATAMSHDFNLAENSIGDCRLMTFCGYTFCKPVDIELIPGMAVSCQIVYRDDKLQHPGEDDWPEVQLTGEMMNLWLVDYLRAECGGAELADLCESYASHRFVKTLQEQFPRYVESRIAELDSGERIAVEAVTVTVQAKGEFLAELRRLQTEKAR